MCHEGRWVPASVATSTWKLDREMLLLHYLTVDQTHWAENDGKIAWQGWIIISATSPASQLANTPAQYSPTSMPTAAAVMVAAVATPVSRLRPLGVTVPKAYGMSPPPGGGMVVEGGVPLLLQRTGVDTPPLSSLLTSSSSGKQNYRKRTTRRLARSATWRRNYYIIFEWLCISPQFYFSVDLCEKMY